MNDAGVLDRNKDGVRRCIEEAWDRGETSGIADLVHPSLRRHHERNQDQDTHGVEGFAAWVREVRRRMPDLEVNIVLMAAETASARARRHGGSGTRTTLPGVTGAKHQVTLNCTCYQIHDGRIENGQVYTSGQHAADSFFNVAYQFKPIPDRLASSKHIAPRRTEWL